MKRRNLIIIIAILCTIVAIVVIQSNTSTIASFTNINNSQSINTKSQPKNSEEEKHEYTEAAVEGESKEIKIEDNQFKPQTITVEAGTTIIWHNVDKEPHSATADVKSFDTSIIPAGEKRSVQFAKPGIYPYHSENNADIKGTVTVKK